MDDLPPDEEEASKGRKNSPKLIVFPGGKGVSTRDTGADYVVGQSGNVPTADIVDPSEIDREIRDRTAYVRRQELVRVVEDGSPTSDIIDRVLLEIAEELSHLKYERRKAVREGKSTLNHTVSRIASLGRLSDILLKRKEASLTERLDLKSPRFQAVFKVWMNFFHESMEKVGIPEEQIDLVFQQMKADMIDWEKKMAGVE